MKDGGEPGGYSEGGAGYPLDAPYASASGPVSENTGPDWAKTTPLKASIERIASIRRRIMAPPRQSGRLVASTIPSIKAHVRYWHIASFRCYAVARRLSGHS